MALTWEPDYEYQDAEITHGRFEYFVWVAKDFTKNPLWKVVVEVRDRRTGKIKKMRSEGDSLKTAKIEATRVYKRALKHRTRIYGSRY